MEIFSAAIFQGLTHLHKSIHFGFHLLITMELVLIFGFCYYSYKEFYVSHTIPLVALAELGEF